MQTALESGPFGAFLLAGGSSRRMGQDKAALSYQGIPLLDHIRDLARKAGATPVLVGGGASADVPDPFPGAGPANALCALANAALDGMPPAWVVLPVDMPLLGPGLLQRLARTPGHAAHFMDQPLPFLLRLDTHVRTYAGEVAHRLAARDSISLYRVLEDLRATVLTPSDAEQAQLVNANTPTDWQAVLASR